MEDNNKADVWEVVHWHVIKVYSQYPREIIEYVLWDNLRFELSNKYRWYFKYRAALLQVKYPKCDVDYRWGHSKPQGKILEYQLINRIKGKKATITKYENRLEMARKEWTGFFPIEDDLLYKRAVDKINRLKQELKELTTQ